MELRTEVVIVGGGATGAGIARDLALRGIPCLLVEKGDLTSGASGRNHGLLHSGARYAVTDPQTARECIAENRVLRRVAPHLIEETGGLFISLPEDDFKFREEFLDACARAGIPTAVLSPDQAMDLEPRLNPKLLGAIEVPDGAIDPFSLVLENVKDAQDHGAKFLFHTEAISLLEEGGKVVGVRVRDYLNGETHSVHASFVVNATGAWANHFLRLTGLRIPMALSKGSLLITDRRLSHRVINRCRKPSDGDIIVPGETVSILGTTSIRLEDVEDFQVSLSEVDLLVAETSKMIPAIGETRLLRAFAGIRPLFGSEEADDRAISRGFTLIDHGQRDRLQRLITITGGKLVTYRLMAEKTCDLLSDKMAVHTPCSTHRDPLPGARERMGWKERFEKFSKGEGEVLCDCELVFRSQVEGFLKEGKMKDLRDLLHRTRLAKGTCQGGFCVFRLLGLLHELGLTEEDSGKTLRGFLEERWKGTRPVLWGTSVKEEELIEGIYKGLFNVW